jgi:hypothetical protein
MDEGAPESGGVIVKIMAVGLNKEKGRQAFGLLPFKTQPPQGDCVSNPK